jgi:hypothetical protein
MKIFLTSFILISSWSLFSQMTLTELQNILKLNQSQFETYCLRNQYELGKYWDDDVSFGTEYSKGIGKKTKYITLYDKFYDKGKTLTYQTLDFNEYLTIKTQVENAGFKIIDTYILDNGYKYVDYSNSKYLFGTSSGKNSSSGNDCFDISISYKEHN